MSQQNQPKQECKCDKKIKALEKQIADLSDKFAQLERQIQTLRKVVRQ